MRNLKSYGSFVLVIFVAAIFMITISGCSNDNSKNSDIAVPANEVTEPISDNDNTVPYSDEVSTTTTVTIPVEQTLVCGNNQLEDGEECDGSVLPDVTCQSQGYDTGAISCTSDCNLDLSECITSRIDSCTDSDDGLNYEVKGTVKVTNDDGSTKQYTDYCRHGSAEGYVYEYYCANGTVASADYNCPKGCNNNGACYQYS